jgi:CRP-like cAMP-binding protein
MSPLYSLDRNLILAPLPTAEKEILAPLLHPMLLHHADVLCELHSPCEWVYFPKAGIISMVVTSENGTEVEAALGGFEGVVGVLEALTGSESFGRFMVQNPGSGWRMSASVFAEQFMRLPTFRERILLHQHTLIAVTAQGALCNRLHALEARLSRWLLTVHDRVEGDHLELTQEFIGTMLGTRRVGVTEAMGSLRSLGLIETHRGCVTILDREGMEKSACECYKVTRDLFARLG